MLHCTSQPSRCPAWKPVRVQPSCAALATLGRRCDEQGVKPEHLKVTGRAGVPGRRGVLGRRALATASDNPCQPVTQRLELVREAHSDRLAWLGAVGGFVIH